MEKFRPQPENPQHNAPEAGAGPIGLPPPGPEHPPQAGGDKSPEHQPIPDVWDVLEQQVKVQERYSSLGELPERRVRKKLYRDDLEVRQAEDAVREKGTPRNKHILDLFYRTQPVLSPSRDGFQEFRARVEALTDEEIAEELHKHLEAMRKRTTQGPVFYSGVGLFELLKRKDKKL